MVCCCRPVCCAASRSGTNRYEGNSTRRRLGGQTGSRGLFPPGGSAACVLLAMNWRRERATVRLPARTSPVGRERRSTALSRRRHGFATRRIGYTASRASAAGKAVKGEVIHAAPVAPCAELATGAIDVYAESATRVPVIHAESATQSYI
jgi:hypothetical protein